MKFMHILNAVLWFANAAVWFGYAHVPMMAAASLVAVVGSLMLVLARMES